MDASFEFNTEYNANNSPRLVSVRLRRNVTNFDRVFNFRMMQNALASHAVQQVQRAYPLMTRDQIMDRVTGFIVF